MVVAGMRALIGCPWAFPNGSARRMSDAVGQNSMTPDPRLVAVVRAIVADAARRVAPAIVVARGVERLMAIIEGERPAERIRRENASALQEMAALGDTRDSAWQV